MADSVASSTRVIGSSIPKRDAKFKATGAARYAGDVRVGKRGYLCGKVLRSPYPHAAIVSIDTAEAASMNGVFAVVTGEDATPARIGRFLRDRTVLARDKVRHVGEPVAAVAAIDEATAVRALSLIRVEYRELPAVFTVDEALAQDAPLIHEDLANYEDIVPSHRCGNQRHLVMVDRGDVEAAFAQADVVVEGVFTTQSVHQGFIEPRSCVAEVDKDGKVTVWPANKGPFLNRAMISRGLGLPLAKVRIITPTIGGDFGGKGAPTIEPICALLTIKTGRAVKMALDTQEDLATNFVRHPATINLRLAARRDGMLLGVDGEVIYNCGAYCDGVLGMAPSCCYLQGPYRVPAVRLRGHSVFTNSVPAGHVRAPGVPQTILAIESLVDELARRLDLNPFQVRRLNALREGDPAPDGNGVMGRNGLCEAIDKAAEHVGHAMPKLGRNQGVGVACGAWHYTLAGHGNPTKCIVKLNEDGSATLLTGMADIGAGQHVVLSQVVAEVLGIEPDEVTVVGGDTELTPYDQGPGASRGTVRVANATRFAAEDARHQLISIAASKLEANPGDLEIGDRRVYVKGTPDRGISVAALAGAALLSPSGAIIGTGPSERQRWMEMEHNHGKVVDEASFGTHAAQVEVDPETGQVTVLKYVAAQDVGTALNPLNAIGQVHGAVAAGLGYALTEELILQNGRIVNPSFANYHMPAADIVPDVHTILIEQPSVLGPYGARGIGEVSVTPVAPAIANAIYDAVGVRMRDLPITPEKILRALKEKKKGASLSP